LATSDPVADEVERGAKLATDPEADEGCVPEEGIEWQAFDD
jgi:hypothetical protein